MFIVSDLDGTLASKKTPVSELNRSAFRRCREMGGICAIATGRSLLGVQEELESDFPIDYLIFSSGAAIYDWQKKSLLHQRSLDRVQIKEVCSYLNGFDFTIQLDAPGTHRFLYKAESASNLDFSARLKMHENHGSALDLSNLPSAASEFIVIQPPETGTHLFEKVRADLGQSYNVVRATSPLDGKSVWIEIFHSEASKGKAADWIRKLHQLPKTKTCALGNDYNDLQLLAWAEHPLVVGDAASELLEKYASVRNHRDSALDHAFEVWLKKLNP